MKGAYKDVIRKSGIVIAVIALFLTALYCLPAGKTSSIDDEVSGAAEASTPRQDWQIKIDDTFKRGETLFDVFKREGLDQGQLHEIRKSALGVFDFSRVKPGRGYSILVDDSNSVQELTYNIDERSLLSIRRTHEGFHAQKVPIEYEVRVGTVSGTISENLVSVIDDLGLALDLSDIFSWDIDFTTDLRKGDTFRLAAEELWLDGEFKGFGNVLAAEFINNGTNYKAYRFVQDGKADYFDHNGRSLRRSFLKAPLSYRRISSGFTRKRFHPVLRTYRPHLGVDYAARSGTPVSCVGDGTVEFSGYKGGNGKMVVVRHAGGYKTYYGHLSRIGKGLRRGAKVSQGQVIGYVGSTGLATGPHLDFRIKQNGSFINPLRLDLPRGEPIGPSLAADFENYRERLDSILFSADPRTAGLPAPGSG